MQLKERPFKDWTIDRYKATSPDGKYCLWVSNGFMLFTDHTSREQLLSLVNIWQRWKLWREIKKEMRARITELYQQ